MQELTHYMNGEHVKGTSGRFADVINPATGEVQAKCPLASNAELDQAVAYRRRRAARMGRDQPAAPRAGDDEVRRSAEPRHGQAGRGAEPRARQDPARRRGRRAARP